MPRIIAMMAAVCALASCSRSLDEMSAGDMAGLVREHADDLVRRLRFHQRADIDEDAPRVGDEGVEGSCPRSARPGYSACRDWRRAGSGSVYSRSNCSISASRMTGRPAFFGSGLRLGGDGRQRDGAGHERGERARDWFRTARLLWLGGHVHVVGTRGFGRNLLRQPRPVKSRQDHFWHEEASTRALECGKSGASPVND